MILKTELTFLLRLKSEPEDVAREHSLQCRKSAFSLVIITGSAHSAEYASLLALRRLKALHSTVAQKELLEKLLAFLVSLYYFCLPFSARVFFFYSYQSLRIVPSLTESLLSRIHY